VKLATYGTQDEDKQNKNNPEKLATYGTQDEDTICDGHHYTQANTNNVNMLFMVFNATFNNISVISRQYRK
jgi:hypothetical protein